MNLGQNNIYGEIPPVIGGGRNDGGRSLTNLRQFISLFEPTDPSFQELKQKIKKFFRKYRGINELNDLLWVDRSRSFSSTINLQEVMDEYIKAEENRLLTMIFQNVRKMDPVRFFETLKY